MRERPILFSAPMVRAILDGTKTQTRRVVKGLALDWLSPPISFSPEYVAHTDNAICPYGQPGDRLWVREAFIHEPADYCWEASVSIPCRPAMTAYRADAEDTRGGSWKPSIHMPRWASRITLEITGVRVERLQDISEEDSVAEGCTKNHNGYFLGGPHAVSGRKQMATAQQAYRDLWESTHGPGSWDANPWVWVVEFRRVGQEGGAA